MKTKMKDYLPKKQNIEIVNVQGQIQAKLFKDVKTIMKRERLTWNEVLIACLERFVDELKEGK